MRKVVMAATLALACGEKQDPVSFEPPLVCAAPDAYCPVKRIFGRSCALSGCHVPGGLAPMSLEPDAAHGNLVNVPGVSLCGVDGVRVVPGSLDDSCLYRLVTSDDDPALRMPLDREPLPGEDRAAIADWILAGAPP